MTKALLQNRQVLVVEDEYMLAEVMSRNLRDAGAIVFGPVSDVRGALALLEEQAEIDAAVLDINLGEDKVYPVVDVLLARGAKCVFATGNDLADVPAAYASLKRCEKPIEPECIVRALIEGNPTAVLVAEDNPADIMTAIRSRLDELIQVAVDNGETLLAAKLCEAVDVVSHR